jgi:hypothetical protein
MKHLKLFEQFTSLNEQKLKVGRDEPLAKAILAYKYAPEGSENGDRLLAMGLHPSYDFQVRQVYQINGWAKDAIKVLSGGMRIPSDVSIGTVVALAAGNGKSYYFDDVDFVEGDKTIVPDTHKLTMSQFIGKLIKQGIIEEPTYDVMNEASADPNAQVKKEAISKLSDFFRVPANALTKFNFDGKDNIKELTKALNSTSDQGTEQYYRIAIQLAKRDLGLSN